MLDARLAPLNEKWRKDKGCVTAANLNKWIINPKFHIDPDPELAKKFKRSHRIGCGVFIDLTTNADKTALVVKNMMLEHPK